jgi:putative MATE family efflux protein
MQRSKEARLITGDIAPQLFKLTIPMLFGMVGLIIFNLVDTFFVGKLGTDQLAALSFTFPVVLIINSLALGVGVGASAVISRAVGEGDHHKVQRLCTDALSLAFLIVVIFITIGLTTIEPTFRMLGANPKILALIKEYMSIWYFGMIFVMFPMVGNNAIRALGDTKTPGIIMMIAAIANATLDPLLIFGIGPFPRLGIAGAAIATVFGRFITFCAAIYVLAFREKILIFEKVSPAEVLDSWKKILYVGIPTALTRMVIPLAAGIITRLLSGFGKEAVAGYGVASRLEFFALAAVMALASVMGPFVGQNWGAGKFGRVKTGITYSRRFSLIYGGVLFIVLSFLAAPIASLFNKNPEVIRRIVLYLRIVPLAYGFQGIMAISGMILNVLNKPFHASALTIIQMFVIYVPLALLGSKLLGIPGIFGALAISYLIVGVASHFVLKKVIWAKEKAF